jgi:hypothetical protein
VFDKWSRANPVRKVGNSSLLLIALVSQGIAFLAHGLAAHLDAVSIVHQAVEDAVGESGIADLLVPARHGNCDVRIVERAW